MKRYNSILLAVLLAGCGGDSVQDKNLDEAMSREAMCVAASERFFLYRDAARHLEHGLDAGRLRFERRGVPNDFLELALEARKLLTNLSPTFSADFLKEKCNRHITNIEFERGKP